LPHLALFVVAEPEVLPVEERIDGRTVDDRIVQIELIAWLSVLSALPVSLRLLWDE